MQENKKKASLSFPDPLAPASEKKGDAYGLSYARAIQKQWGKIEDQNSLYRKRNKTFENSRDYANGNQDTTIYKQILTALDPNDNDGSLLNLDFTPVPILPKFSRIVVNKVLSKQPYPSLEAIDPISLSFKDKEKRAYKQQVKFKPILQEMKGKFGKSPSKIDPDTLPETEEEADIILETNGKTDSEIAAQIGTDLTLEWCNFNDGTYRRNVNDLVSCGMAVTKRNNDPNYGITQEYVDPTMFIHSYTEDPNFDDIVYAGHIKRISISELKRIAGDQFTEEQYKKIADSAKSKNDNDSGKLNHVEFDRDRNRNVFGYDEYMVDILNFEFISVDPMYFEEKENRYGNKNFFYKGYSYKKKNEGVFGRTPSKMDVGTVYGGSYILGTDFIYNYGMCSNIPKNIHDISRVRMSYSVVATNIRRMVPKSMIDSTKGFADMLQITHLKIQQAIAKAKPDGLIIDIEGLDNVTLGKGGELEPLDLHDIYEKTGVFYYRSKNPEGGFQNPPVREIGNNIRNINELIAIYNHYLRMIRDATGVNEVMDASSPKGDALVGVQQQAIAAANNAIYDITNAALVLYKKVVDDIVRCLQIIPEGSVIERVYHNAIGETNVSTLSSFKDLPMYNFGVVVQKEMDDKERSYLEQNIQISLSQKELDIEDAIAIRGIRDIEQAQRLLVVKRKNRMKAMQEMAQKNVQAQAQAQAQASQAASQAKIQEIQIKGQMEQELAKLKISLELEAEKVRHEMRKEIENIKAQATLGFKTDDQEFREKLEVLKEDRKDERTYKQADQQSKLIKQRSDDLDPDFKLKSSESDIVNKLID